MSIYSKMLPKIENRDYETHFWNAMRGKAINRETLNVYIRYQGGKHIPQSRCRYANL